MGSFSLGPQPSGFGFAWLIKPELSLKKNFEHRLQWTWLVTPGLKMWAVSPRGLSSAQSVIGEDKPHFKGLGDQIQIRTPATIGKRLRRLGGFWSQGIWPGWYALRSHFVRSVRMKWKLAAVYFMVCVLSSESLCKIIFNCLLTWLPSPTLGGEISCSEMTCWQMQTVPCVISHSGMLKRKYFLQEHTSKITMKVIWKSRSVHKYFLFNFSGMEPAQRAQFPCSSDGFFFFDRFPFNKTNVPRQQWFCQRSKPLQLNYIRILFLALLSLIAGSQ